MLYTILLQDIVLNLKYTLVEILLLIKHYHIIFYIISQNYLYNMGIGIHLYSNCKFRFIYQGIHLLVA